MQSTRFARAIAALLLAAAGTTSAAGAAPDAADAQWQANALARKNWLEATVGPLPRDILKMKNMVGVWPGGGLYAVPASKLGPHLAVYTTFGLSNADMPATTTMAAFALGGGNPASPDAHGTLRARTPAPRRPGAAGYGYELVVIADADQRWPLNLLQWAVNSEILEDIGLLGRVDKYSGFVAEAVDIGPGEQVDVLITHAQPPLPAGVQLPAGRVELLVATVINSDEMDWSDKNGRNALRDKLREAGVGQVSVLKRASVVH